MDAVANHHEELIEKVRDFEPSVEHFDYLKEFFRWPMTSDDPVEIGFNKLAIHKMSFSGLGEKGSVCGGQGQTKYDVHHRWSPDYIVKKIEYVHDCFAWRQPHISQVDYSYLITDPGENVMIYADPPYYDQGAACYSHAFYDADHVKLSRLLKNTKHNWVLSYDDHWRIRDLYHWADIKVLDVQYSIANHIWWTCRQETGTSDHATSEAHGTLSGKGRLSSLPFFVIHSSSNMPCFFINSINSKAAALASSCLPASLADMDLSKVSSISFSSSSVIFITPFCSTNRAFPASVCFQQFGQNLTFRCCSIDP